MTQQEALERVNREPRPSQTIHDLLSSPWIHLAAIAFSVGVAWTNLHAEFAQTKLELQAEISVMKTDIHTMRVLACRSYPHDSVCVP